MTKPKKTLSISVKDCKKSSVPKAQVQPFKLPHSGSYPCPYDSDLQSIAGIAGNRIVFRIEPAQNSVLGRFNGVEVIGDPHVIYTEQPVQFAQTS